MRLPKVLALSALVLGAAFSKSAYAVTQGTLGLTSTGVAAISVTVPNLIKITNMADIAFGTWSGSGDLNSNVDVCVYTNKASGTYRITATGSGAASAFTLASGGNTLPYNVYYNDVSGTTGAVQVTAATVLNGQTGAHVTSQTCGGSNTGNYHVEILDASLQAVPSGAYTGTLTLVVEPV